MSDAVIDLPARKWSREQYGVVILTAAALAGGVLLHAYAPAALHLPSCVFHELTGLYCPGCGATRALHHLLNLEFATAIRCNLMFVLALPFLTLWLIRKALRTFHLYILDPWLSPVLTLSIANTRILTAVILAWCLVRNLAIPWLAIPPQ